LQHDVAVLAATAGLLMNLPSTSSPVLRDGLAVGHLRLADVGLDAELALHAVDDDLEVQLAHAGDDGLAGSSSVRTRNDGSSCARRCSAMPIFSWSALVLGSTAMRDHGLGEHHALER
jgi:hypothetical protein